MSSPVPTPAPAPSTPPESDLRPAPMDELAELRGRLVDAALGELAPEELAGLQAAITAHPDRAALQAGLQRMDALLLHTAENPGLAPLQPRESWRVQTLHKAKIEAARLRKNRVSKSMPVARPPVTHRQLAGLVPQTITAHADLPVAPDAGAAALSANAAWPAGPGSGTGGGEPVPAVRRLFWLMMGVGTAGVLVMLFVAVRVMQRWQTAAPPPAAETGNGPAGGRPGVQGTAGRTPPRPLAPRELLELKIAYPAMAQVLATGDRTAQIELGGVLNAAAWPLAPAEAADPVSAGCDRYLGPVVAAAVEPATNAAGSGGGGPGWDRIDLEGDLSHLTWVYIPDPASGLRIVLRPKPQGANTPESPQPGGGWELELRKNITQLAVYDIPAPPGSANGAARRLRALAIERLPVGPDKEQLRFKAATEAATGDADSSTIADNGAEWVVLSERLLPVRSGAGRWAIELPQGETLPALTYILQLTVERAPRP